MIEIYLESRLARKTQAMTFGLRRFYGGSEFNTVATFLNLT